MFRFSACSQDGRSIPPVLAAHQILQETILGILKPEACFYYPAWLLLWICHLCAKYRLATVGSNPLSVWRCLNVCLEGSTSQDPSCGGIWWSLPHPPASLFYILGSGLWFLTMSLDGPLYSSFVVSLESASSVLRPILTPARKPKPRLHSGLTSWLPPTTSRSLLSVVFRPAHGCSYVFAEGFSDTIWCVREVNEYLLSDSLSMNWDVMLVICQGF